MNMNTYLFLEVQEDANVLAFIPEEKDVFGQQIVKDMIENILARVFRNTRGKNCSVHEHFWFQKRPFLSI